MKNLKTLLLLLVSMLSVSFAFTSCNTDSDDNTVSDSDIAVVKSKMPGVYSGKNRLYYLKGYYMYQAYYQPYDSINASWRVSSEGTVTTGFPVHMLDSAIYVSDADKETEQGKKYLAVQKAISNLEQTSPMSDMQIKSTLIHPYVWWVTNNCIQFYVTPEKLQLNLEYDGARHDVFFEFSTNLAQFQFSQNDVSGTNNMFAFQSTLDAIYLDKYDANNKIPSDYFRQVFFSCTK